MRAYRFIGVSLIVACMAKPVSADEPGEKSFVVFPVKTDLQRALHTTPTTSTMGSTSQHARAHVFVDGPSVIDDEGRLIANKLDLSSIRKSLEPYRDRRKGVVHFQILHQSTRHRAAQELLVFSLMGYGPRFGFRRARVSSSYLGERYKWRDFINRIDASFSDKPDRDEPGAGDGLVRVYPVHTRLGRYLSHNSDCVADVLVVVKKDAETSLLPKLRRSLKKHIAELKLDHTKKLLIRIEYERDAKGFVDWLVENESTRLARDLGFDFVSLNMTMQ